MRTRREHVIFNFNFELKYRKRQGVVVTHGTIHLKSYEIFFRPKKFREMGLRTVIEWMQCLVVVVGSYSSERGF